MARPRVTVGERMSWPLGFFSVEQAARLAKLSPRQLRYWDREGVYSPEYGDPDHRYAYNRIYSFRDLVALRTLSQLRKHVSLQELRRIGMWLRERYERPWSELVFYRAGGRVYFDDPRTGVLVATRPKGQTAIPVELERIAAGVQKDVEQLRRRSPGDIGRVTQRRGVIQSSAILAGTRIPTSAIWSFYRDGYAPKEILQQYPHLTLEDVKAAIEYEEKRQRKQAS